MAARWQSPDVWATAEIFDGNVVHQLLVPASAGFMLDVGESPSSLVASCRFGVWPAVMPGQAVDGDTLTLRVGLGSKPGQPVGNGERVGSRVQSAPDDVVSSYVNVLSFSEGAADQPRLRRPQLGALHAELGYWTIGRVAPGDGRDADRHGED